MLNHQQAKAAECDAQPQDECQEVRVEKLTWIENPAHETDKAAKGCRN
jgi:hypothetical protein